MMIIEEVEKEQKMVIVKNVKSRKYFCDKCGKEMHKEPYSETRYKVEFTEGYSYPEGTDLDIVEAYLCKECSVDIKKLLEDNGVKFTEREESW